MEHKQNEKLYTRKRRTNLIYYRGPVSIPAPDFPVEAWHRSVPPGHPPADRCAGDGVGLQQRAERTRAGSTEAQFSLGIAVDFPSQSSLLHTIRCCITDTAVKSRQSLGSSNTVFPGGLSPREERSEGHRRTAAPDHAALRGSSDKCCGCAQGSGTSLESQVLEAASPREPCSGALTYTYWFPVTGNPQLSIIPLMGSSLSSITILLGCCDY